MFLGILVDSLERFSFSKIYVFRLNNLFLIEPLHLTVVKRGRTQRARSARTVNERVCGSIVSSGRCSSDLLFLVADVFIPYRKWLLLLLKTDAEDKGKEFADRKEKALLKPKSDLKSLLLEFSPKTLCSSTKHTS